MCQRVIDLCDGHGGLHMRAHQHRCDRGTHSPTPAATDAGWECTEIVCAAFDFSPGVIGIDNGDVVACTDGIIMSAHGGASGGKDCAVTCNDGYTAAGDYATVKMECA